MDSPPDIERKHGYRRVAGQGGACMISCFSCVRLFVTLWTAALQAPLSMGFSRQEYWSGLPCPPPGYLPDPGIEPRLPALQVNSLPPELPRKPHIHTTIYKINKQQGPVVLYSIYACIQYIRVTLLYT